MWHASLLTENPMPRRSEYGTRGVFSAWRKWVPPRAGLRISASRLSGVCSYLGLRGQLAPPDPERTLSMRSTCGVQYKGARTRSVSSRFSHVMPLCCFQPGFCLQPTRGLWAPPALPGPGATRSIILHATCFSRVLRYIVMPIVTPQRLIMSYSTSIYRVRPQT